MSQLIITARFFWVAIFECLVLMALSGMTVFESQLDKLSDDSVSSWGWVSWGKFAGPILLSMLIALKGFMSDAMSKAKQKQSDATSFLVKGNE